MVAQLVDQLSARPFDTNEIALSKDRQVVGDFRLRLTQSGDEISDGCWPIHQAMEEAQTKRIPKNSGEFSGC